MGTNVGVIADLTAAQVFDDLSGAFKVILEDSPQTSWLRFGEAVIGDKEAKVTFTDETRTETTLTLDANYVAASGDITVTDSSLARVGDIVTIDGHRDVNSLQPKFRVTAIPDATSLTVSLIHGADTNLTSTGQAMHRTGSIADNHVPSAFDDVREPDLYVNYVQWMQEAVDIGRKLQELTKGGLAYSLEDAEARATEQALYRMQYQVYNAVINGVGQAETSGLGATMGGILEYVQTASLANRIDASAATLSETMINNLMDKLVNLGLPNSARLVFLVGTKQARVLSGLRDDKVQYSTTGQDQVLGTNVQSYVTELSGWSNVQILIDRNLPDDLGVLFAPEFITAKPKAGMQLIEQTDATQPGQLGRRWLMRTAMTLEVEGRTNFHGTITDIG
jgi:hypothetical protein